MTSRGPTDNGEPEDTLLTAALEHADRGWRVFPCTPGSKVPLGKFAPHGFRDATSNPNQIRRWWLAEPYANIGLPTGVKFDVLDIDNVSAFETLAAVRSPSDSDINGPMVTTRRGLHYYVAPTGFRSTVRLGGIPGLDWRGEGGYVVAPPSVSVDGGTWAWVENRGSDVPVMPAPGWILNLFDQRVHFSAQPAGPAVGGERAAHGPGALERELDRLVRAPNGTRNDQLNRSAFALGKLVGTGVLNAEEIGNALLCVALHIGLSNAEAIATIRSGMKAGIHNPRRVAS